MTNLIRVTHMTRTTHAVRRLMVAVALVKCCTAPAYAAVGPHIRGDVVYGHKLGMALTLDVLQPEAHANGAGIIFIVSGGWISRWHPPERAAERFESYLKRGFTVFMVRHGSSPKFNIPEIVPDVRRAVRFIRLHAHDYGVDPDRLGVCGASAGGHLALLIGTASDKGDPGARDEVLKTGDRVAAVVAYFPPVDLRTLSVDPDDIADGAADPKHVVAKAFPALIFDHEEASAMSPLVQVSADDPPTLLIHGDKDWLVPLSASESMHDALKAKGVATDLIVVEGAGHGFRGADAVRARRALLDWFEKYLVSEK